jgi:hypothetical protein
MTILFFAFYFIILLLIGNRIIKKTTCNIRFATLAAIFGFKVLLGCLYGYIFLHYYGGDDTWGFFKDSIAEYQKLIHHPLQFINDLSPFKENYTRSNFFHGLQLYLSDFEYWTMVKLLALCNLFSQGNYYIDVLFFDFMIFWGPFLLFKLLLSYFPSKKTILIVVLFFIPSVGFWLSGIRAEGLLLLFIALSVYYAAKWVTGRRIVSAIWSVAGLWGILAFRGMYLLAFVPAFLSWLFTIRGKQRPLVVFTFVYLLAAVVFFGTSLVSSKNNLPSAIVSRQREFLSLHGKTVFKLDSLQPSVVSFLHTAPQAFLNGFLRPFIWEAKGILQILSALEVYIFWLVTALFFIFPEKNWKTVVDHPLILLFIFYGCSLILFIGLVVPFPGAIVRYKAIPELLLLTAMTVATDYKKNFKLNFLLI